MAYCAMVLNFKILFVSLIIGSMVLPFFNVRADEKTASDTTFKAVVLEVIKQQKSILPDGTPVEQQDVRLKGLDGDYKNKYIIFRGIGDVDVIKKNLYQVGEKVLVVAATDDNGETSYYITDYVRTNSLLLLFVVFVLSLLLIGGWKGFRSLASLAVSFLVIMKFIVPQIVSGADPVVVTVIGSLLILSVIIYFTEGLNRLSHVSVASIFVSLLITMGLSWLFVGLTKLSGLSSEESSFLIGVGTGTINFRGLLMAGIIIGALGVLDDVVISQVVAANEIYKADRHLGKWELFRRAYRVGVSHISSMTNTLFLAYAGASLSLLILFGSGQSGFTSLAQAVNNELIATEIVRTLAGSIGLVMAVPISTLLAVIWIRKD